VDAIEDASLPPARRRTRSAVEPEVKAYLHAGERL